MACLSKKCLQGKKNKNGNCYWDLVPRDVQSHLAEVQTSGDKRNGTHTSFNQQIPYRNLNHNSNLCAGDTDQEYQKQHSNQVVHQLFGFNPTGPLKLYTGDPVYYETIPDIIKTHRTVRDSGCPNFLKCRIPVSSNLKIENWRLYLAEYWDQQIVDLLQYGFPLDFDRQCQLISTEVNHASAIQNSDHVKHYFQEELTHKAILGPFTQPPFPIHVSPSWLGISKILTKKGPL